MNGGLIAMLVLIVVFAAIVFIVIMVKRHSKLFHKDEKPSDEKIVKDELNRMLEDVKDVQTKKAMEDFEKTQSQNETEKPKEDNK